MERSYETVKGPVPMHHRNVVETLGAALGLNATAVYNITSVKRAL